MSKFDEVKKRDAARLTREQNLKVYYEFVDSHPELPNVESTRRAFEDFMGDLTDRDYTYEDFELALQSMPVSRITRVRVPTPDEIVRAENAHRRSLSLPELRELARKENPAPRASELPTTWTPPNRKESVDISTSAALKALAKNDITSFKRLCERFGSGLVNQRLGYKPAAQPGQQFSSAISRHIDGGQGE